MASQQGRCRTERLVAFLTFATYIALARRVWSERLVEEGPGPGPQENTGKLERSNYAATLIAPSATPAELAPAVALGIDTLNESKVVVHPSDNLFNQENEREFAFNALLQRRMSPATRRVQVGTGFLISNSAVVTSGQHCKDLGDPPSDRLTVLLGANILGGNSFEPDVMGIEDSSERVAVASISMHPYHGATIEALEYNICVVDLDKETQIEPVSMGQVKHELDMRMSTVGWGMTRMKSQTPFGFQDMPIHLNGFSGHITVCPPNLRRYWPHSGAPMFHCVHAEQSNRFVGLSLGDYGEQSNRFVGLSLGDYGAPMLIDYGDSKLVVGMGVRAVAHEGNVVSIFLNTGAPEILDWIGSRRTPFFPVCDIVRGLFDKLRQDKKNQKLAKRIQERLSTLYTAETLQFVVYVWDSNSHSSIPQGANTGTSSFMFSRNNCNMQPNPLRYCMISGGALLREFNDPHHGTPRHVMVAFRKHTWQEEAYQYAKSVKEQLLQVLHQQMTRYSPENPPDIDEIGGAVLEGGGGELRALLLVLIAGQSSVRLYGQGDDVIMETAHFYYQEYDGNQLPDFTLLMFGLPNEI